MPSEPEIPKAAPRSASWLARVQLNRPRPARIVRFNPEVGLVPQLCANCCAPPSSSQLLTLGKRSLLIPYCARCAEQLAHVGSRRLAACLASLLLAVALLLTLPGLPFRLSLMGFVAAVAVAGVLPLGLVRGLGKRPLAGQAASACAVFAQGGHSLVCFNVDWAEQLAELHAAQPLAQRFSEPVLRAWVWAPVALSLACAPSVYAFLRPSLVVLNFGDAACDLQLNGTWLARVEPTSLESRHAGSRLNLPVGPHTLSVHSPEGQLLGTHSIQLKPGALHLLSLQGADYCFWLEQDAYGKAAGQPRSYQALNPQQGFWVIPAEVDSLFASNPSPSSDDRSSGGTRTALRQARCDQMPPAAAGR
jgi:hypothetical protein